MTNNSLTDDTKAIILLCGVFGKDNSEKPLSLTEYSSLVHWLIAVNKRPEDLLHRDNIANAAMGSGIDKQRLETLLGRGVQLGFSIEEWQRNGIWVISRSDTDYPVRYKKHLKDKAPALLFGVGNRSLLSGGGLGIVGSRQVDQHGEAFTRQVAQLCASNRMPVVSGGARGVDQTSINTTLEAGGTAIGILAENLLKKSVERKNRQAIANGQLLLLSPYHPNARFTVGNAMGRNKLIYALADYGLVVSAEHQKGGTWAGAEEELRREFPRPVFVRNEGSIPEGNKKLLELGAIPWPVKNHSIDLNQELHEKSKSQSKTDHQSSLNLFGVHEAETIEYSKGPLSDEQTTEVNTEKVTQEEEKSDPIYQLVLPEILNKLNAPATLEELAHSLDVMKSQLNAWLNKAIEQNEIEKLSNPTRYQRKKIENENDPTRVEN